MPDRSVAVTGVGIIGALGCTAGEFALAWQQGKLAARTCLPDLAGTPLAAETVTRMPPFDAVARLGSRRMLKFMSEAATLGCLAAREALEEAGVRKRFPAERVGLYAGTGLAAANVQDVHTMVEQSIDENGQFSCQRFGERGLAATNPLLSFKILANMPPCLISVLEGIKGPNLILTPWEGQAAAAIIEGWQAVASGEVECALVGAADTPAYPSTFVYLRQAGHLTENEYPSSGAAYLVLESVASARRDGVKVHALIRDLSIGSATSVSDPLSRRLGRTFAAAPAILMGLACCCGMSELSICGVDGQEFRAALGAPS